MILITGSTGFIGKHLVKELSKEYKLRGVIREKNKKPIANLELFYGDITDKSSLEKAFFGVNTIIHAAALTEGKQKDILKTNIEGTRNLVELSIKYKVKKFIFISSDNTLLKKKGPYALSKIESEKIITDSGLNYTILRPNWVYDLEGNKDLKKIILLVKKTYIVPVIGNGNYYLQPLYVGDLVSIVKKVINKESENKIYHIGGAEKISFNELIDEISKDLNIKRRKLHIPVSLCKLLSPVLKVSKGRITEIIQDKISDNSLAVKDLGYNPTSINDSLKKILK